MIIYRITNKINNKNYIGQTSKTIECRWNSHVRHANSNSPYVIHSAIRKYGTDSFEIEEIDNAENQEEINAKEVYWILEYKSNNPNFGYNMTFGGEGPNGFKHSEYSKLKMSVAHSAQSEETRRKISQSMMGKKRPKEVVDKIVCALKARIRKPCSDETKRKISESLCGDKNPNFGKTFSEDHKRRLSESRRAIVLRKSQSVAL